MMRLSLLICLICFMFNQLTASKIYGNLESIDYETLFQSDNKELENKFILLAVGKLLPILKLLNLLTFKSFQK